ncbi:MAG: thiol oxidoreductase, partial [Campylobacterales bacterium]|nr:thiol oxidoreductase [Campylobacterales bacterium]
MTTNLIAHEKIDKKYIVKGVGKKLLTKPIDGLNDQELDTFILGKSFFRIPWVEAPSATTARDGLGPLFNANTCITCHPNNGRGTVFNKNGNLSRGYVVRLSIPSNGSKDHKKQLKYNGFVGEPTYGGQISINGVFGVPFEARPTLKYEDKIVTYPDGEKVVLKKPIVGLKDLNYGELHKNTSISNRLAPQLVGLGLLDKLTDEQILKNQDIEDKDGDGISGKANIVYSPEFKDFRVGRYTWKASAPTIVHQTAGAANNDMSLTNYLFPNENCTSSQKKCLKAPKGDSRIAKFDLPKQRVQAISFYLKNLKIPESKIVEKRGEKLFSQIGCGKCHTPKYKLADGNTIRPFTDLLLHDMGDELSDGRDEFLANKNEWRTPPLW